MVSGVACIHTKQFYMHEQNYVRLGDAAHCHCTQLLQHVTNTNYYLYFLCRVKKNIQHVVVCFKSTVQV